MTPLPATITRDPKYEATLEERETAAAKARAAQSTYKRYTAAFILSTALAAVFSGLVLYGLEVDPEKETSNIILSWVVRDWVRGLLVVGQAVSLGITAYCAHILATGKHNQTWTDCRLQAERLRLELQRLALVIGHAQAPEKFAAAAESFVAFAKGQLKWLRSRSTKHERESGKLTVAAAALAGLMAFAGAIGALKNESVLALVALLGVCAPALVAALKSWSQATLDRERASLHDRSATALNQVLGERADFDKAVAANDLDGALAYAERVFDVLRADHRGFAEGRQSAGANIAAAATASADRYDGD